MSVRPELRVNYAELNQDAKNKFDKENVVPLLHSEKLGLFKDVLNSYMQGDMTPAQALDSLEYYSLKGTGRTGLSLFSIILAFHFSICYLTSISFHRVCIQAWKSVISMESHVT
jgi:hypothetical protein